MKIFRIMLTSVLAVITNVAFAQMSSDDNMHLLDLIQSQRYEEASDFLKEKNPEPITDKKVISRIGYNLQQAGRLAEATTYYERLLALDSTDVSALFSLAGISQRQGSIHEAIHIYQKITEIDSTNFSAYKQLSYLSESYGTILQAGPYLHKANQLKPIDGDIAYSYSKFLKSVKQLKPALAVLDTAIKADTSNLILVRGKAEIAFAMQDWPEVLHLTKHLIDRGEESVPVLKLRGEAFYHSGKFRETIQIFAALEEKEMTSELTLYLMAMSYRNLKDYPKSIEYFEKAIKDGISPNVAQYYAHVADVQQKNKQPRKSITAYQKSLSFEVRPIIYYSMAILYDQTLKDPRSALTYYKKYIGSKPAADHKSYVDYTNYRIAELSTKK